MDATVKKPMQQRSRASLERLLSAGIELLEEKGYEGFSIADVSDCSGVSIGSIYQRFDGKASLFVALQERILERIDAEQRSLFEDLDPDLRDGALVTGAIIRLAALFRRNEAILRVMILRGAVDDDTRRRGSRSSIGLARAYEEFILRSVRRFGHERPDLAADMSFRMVYATLTRRIMSGPTFESETDIGWDEFVAEVARTQVNYLLRPAAS